MASEAERGLAGLECYRLHHAVRAQPRKKNELSNNTYFTKEFESLTAFTVCTNHFYSKKPQ